MGSNTLDVALSVDDLRRSRGHVSMEYGCLTVLVLGYPQRIPGLHAFGTRESACASLARHARLRTC